jgi:hypothetical protein
MNDLKYRIEGFGRKYGFIPYSKLHEDLRDDFGYVDQGLEELAYKVKKEIEDHYVSTEGVIPFHWHRICIQLKALPSKLEYVVEKGKKVHKTIKGYLGQYARGWRNVYINDSLPELDDDGETLKYTLKHELFHSVQELTGTIYEQPYWKVEAEASVFATDSFEDLNFEKTDKWFSYRDWTLKYIRDFGKSLMTTFRRKLRHLYKYFTPQELWAMGMEDEN